jgi:uncharacterized membrane protein YccF (DUF307 family)
MEARLVYCFTYESIFFIVPVVVTLKVFIEQHGDGFVVITVQVFWFEIWILWDHLVVPVIAVVAVIGCSGAVSLLWLAGVELEPVRHVLVRPVKDGLVEVIVP